MQQYGIAGWRLESAPDTRYTPRRMPVNTANSPRPGMTASRYYPRSFTVLVMIAMIVLTIPLALGLASSIRLLQRTADSQHAFSKVSIALTRDVRHAVGAVNAWQRSAGQYHLLQDAEFARPLVQRYEELDTTLTRLQGMLSQPAARRQAGSLKADSAALQKSLAPGRFLSSAVFNTHAPEFQRLHDGASTLQRLADAQVQRNQIALERRVDEARNRLIMLALVTIPLTLILAAVFSWLIHRPIRQLKRAIHQLGRDDLSPLPAPMGPRDLRELGAEINWLRERLQALDAQKKQFLRHISHELKTPLTSLREGIALLHDEITGPLVARQRAIVGILDQSARALQKRIEDLLLYSALVRERSVFQPAPQRLGEAIDVVLARHALTLEKSRLRIERTLAEPVLTADPAQLDTVLDNLLGNAAKFSPEGGCILISSLRAGNWVELDVCDQGAGIDADERLLVFKPFFQGTHQPPSAIKGSGIGLSIVAEILHAQGGSVAVVERARWSTCIRTRWPLVPVAPITPVPTA